MTSNRWNSKLALVALTALILGAAIPVSLFAQTSSTVRYGRNPRNNAVYLIPNRSGPAAGVVATGLSISCAPSRNAAAIGEVVTWVSSVSGGSRTYLYAWSGTDGLSGNTATLPKIYSQNGEKFATLSVTSGGKTSAASCGSVRIGQAQTSSSVFAQNVFGASCYAVPERALTGETVMWVSIVSGVSANTTYEWDGSENLVGNRPLISKTYATNGNKFAFLTVNNNGLRIVAACTNAVFVGPKFVATASKLPASAPEKPATATAPATPAVLELQGLCAASATRAEIGEEILWQSAVTGGTGTYSFSWTGDDGLLSSGTSTAKKYESAGQKKTSVTVSSGGKSRTLSCTPIEIEKRANGLFASGFFSWVAGPISLILAVILAIMIGLAIARRKRAREEAEEEEKDHVR